MVILVWWGAIFTNYGFIMIICKVSLVEKGYLEHQATVAKLGAHMGLGNQVGSQGPCGHQVLQL
jgi:hypothetical protein